MISVDLTARAYELIREGVTVRSRKGGVYKVLMPEKLADKLKGDERIGAEIVARALEKPIRTIAENGGLDGAVVADEGRNAK